MNGKLYDCLEISDLKDMLKKTKDLYGEKVAYKIKIEKDKYKIITHKEVREMVDALGTALTDLDLKDKRIGIIAENRYEWEIAYLSVVCGTGIVVPLDKALPENELESVIERAEIEAIFYSNKYEDILKKIKCNSKNNLKYLISMDLKENTSEVYSQNSLIASGYELIKNGNTKFIDANINSEEMNIMLFTSGTTDISKVVSLSHRNICSNLMDIGSVLDVNSDDILLSILPIHHVFECTVRFLFSLYKGAQTVFCDGLRHIVENLNEYKVSVMACVPSVYEGIYKMIRKKLERNESFEEVHKMLGGNIKLFISGAAALDSNIESKYRELGINIVQGYGLTETSPVVGVGSNKYYKTGSIGRALPSVEVKIVESNRDGIGELAVKGPNVMLGYYKDEEATKEVLKDGWFYTGDLARIDEEGYIFICGRKKSVIVLKNGKNIFPEEMENLINKIDGIKESFVFGKIQSDDKDDVKINVKAVFDRKLVEDLYKVKTEKEIYDVLTKKIKEVNRLMPKYKAIRGVYFTEKDLLKTTTNKIKRQANLDEIRNVEN